MLQYYEGNFLYSDHALLELEINTTKVKSSMEMLKTRARYHGQSVYENKTTLSMGNKKTM